MKILNRDFIGPLEVEYHNLPKEHGVYLLAYIEKDKINPIYIGFTRDLKHRINSLLIQSPIPKEILKNSEAKLFYSLFDQENYLQGQAFEIELIKKFDPIYNSNKYKYIEQAQVTDSKIEKTRRFSSIVAAFTSFAALLAALYFSTGILFDKKNDNTNLVLADNSKISQEYHSALKSIEASKKDIEAVKSEVKFLSSKPANASWTLESSKLNQRIVSLDLD
jgi:predicted GIY-YIG superfamily endonuclease